MTRSDQPAYPYDPERHRQGLTIREYFAAQAMVGLLSGQAMTSQESVAVYAVKMADALIEALNEGVE